MRYLFVAILLAASAPVHAWDLDDTKRQLAYTALHVIDHGQTLDIARDCQRGRIRYERNVFLGECPSRGDVHTYFALTYLGHYVVARMLPPEYRSAWQYVTIGVEANAVAENFSIGLEVRF